MALDNPKEDIKIQEFLRRVDNSYYHRKIENRLNEMKKFPHLGESGRLFMNTYHYVNLIPKKKTDKRDE